MTVYQARLGASVRKTHPESGFRTAGQEAHGEEKEVEEEGARLKQGGGGALIANGAKSATVRVHVVLDEHAFKMPYKLNLEVLTTRSGRRPCLAESFAQPPCRLQLGAGVHPGRPPRPA
jgi:hypothetical protein